MHILSTTKADSKHDSFEFSHKVKGVRITFTIVAMNEKRGREKAWDYVKSLYKAIKGVNSPAIKAYQEILNKQHA